LVSILMIIGHFCRWASRGLCRNCDQQRPQMGNQEFRLD